MTYYQARFLAFFKALGPPTMMDEKELDGLWQTVFDHYPKDQQERRKEDFMVGYHAWTELLRR